MGCLACEDICLFGAVSENEKHQCEIDLAKCRSCGLCENQCPMSCITLVPGTRLIKSIFIDRPKCVGCGLCAKHCPAEAITGQLKQPYVIDHAKCIRCGLCAETCRKNAVLVLY